MDMTLSTEPPAFVGGYFLCKNKGKSVIITACGYGSIIKKGRRLFMVRRTVEKFRQENRPVWFMETWSGMPAKARIVKVKRDPKIGAYAYVNCIRDEESNAIGSQGVMFENLYPSKELLLQDAAEKEQADIDEIKVAIQTMEDCIKFMYNTTVSCAEEYTDWTARRAIREIAMERWGLELE